MGNIVVELRHLKTRQDRWKMFIVEDDRDIHEGSLVDDTLGIRVHAKELLKALDRESIRIVFVEPKRHNEYQTHKREREKPEVIPKQHPLSIDYPDATDYAIVTRRYQSQNGSAINIYRWVWCIKVDGVEVYTCKNWKGTERGAFQSFQTFKRRQNFPILDLCSIRRFGIQTGE